MQLIRLFLLCLVAIGLVYLPAVLGFARVFVPGKSEGSLVWGPDGEVIGSRLIAQAFEGDGYFHPRPSAVDYDAQGAGGSNLSPANPKLTARAREISERHGAGPERLIPADLVTASGSGLDPDISLEAALFQAPRVATARGMTEDGVNRIVDSVKRPLLGPFGGPVLVNVLELNLALDRAVR